MSEDFVSACNCKGECVCVRHRVKNKDEIIEQLQAELELAKEENDALKTELKELYSSKPCPKCGMGITGSCYGCEIKKLQAELAEATSQLAGAITVNNLKDNEIARLKDALQDIEKASYRCGCCADITAQVALLGQKGE